MPSVESWMQPLWHKQSSKLFVTILVQFHVDYCCLTMPRTSAVPVRFHDARDRGELPAVPGIIEHCVDKWVVSCKS